MNGLSCETCRYYLGGGCCRINVEDECGKGEHELWEPNTTSRIYRVADYAVIKTSKGVEFKIDVDDIEKCRCLNWCATTQGYGQTHINGKEVRLHRFLMFGTEQSKMVIDHINGDTKDNRRKNLRACTVAENSMNRRNKVSVSAIAQGVRKRGNRFVAEIRHRGRKLHIGSFKTALEAVEARKREEARLFGEFAPSICRVRNICGGFEAHEERVSDDA